jgi:hypothetical protein
VRVSSKQGVVDVRVWRTDAEMVKHVQLSKRHAVLGNPSAENLVGSFDHQSDIEEDPDASFAIGVLWTLGAFEPQLLILPLDQDRLILVGFDTEIVGLLWHTLEARFRIEFGTYFRSMFYVKDLGILALEEIGVSLISTSGQKLWSFTGDVITEARLNGSRALQLSFMDSPSVTVDIATGLVSS